MAGGQKRETLPSCKSLYLMHKDATMFAEKQTESQSWTWWSNKKNFSEEPLQHKCFCVTLDCSGAAWQSIIQEQPPLIILTFC